MNDKTEMPRKLKSFIFRELVFIENPDEFSETDSLLDAGLDSMGIMRLVMFIEDEFGVTLPDEELVPENVETLASLEGWIERHQQAN